MRRGNPGKKASLKKKVQKILSGGKKGAGKKLEAGGDGGGGRVCWKAILLYQKKELRKALFICGAAGGMG